MIFVLETVLVKEYGEGERPSLWGRIYIKLLEDAMTGKEKVARLSGWYDVFVFIRYKI